MEQEKKYSKQELIDLIRKVLDDSSLLIKIDEEDGYVEIYDDELNNWIEMNIK